MQKTDEMNRLGTVPIRKLMISMGLPMIISMMLQAVYNIVDSAFVSNMSSGGEQALGALTLAFPVQTLMIAISIGTGVGSNAILSKSLGRNDVEKANKVAGNATLLGLIIYAVFLLFGFFGTRIYIESQTSNPVISDMAIEYLRICCTVSIGVSIFAVYEKLLQATGRPIFSTIAQISGALTNIILDPIMIYGWLGLPEMGVAGAAYATVIGQLVSALLAFIFHLKVNKEITNSVKYMKPSGKIIREIYAIGFPAIIAQALMSVMTYGLNIILNNISEAAMTAYGLYYKIQQFVLFAAFGLRDAITPIISFNHGMKSAQRIKQGIKYGMGYTLIIMAAGLIVLEALAVPLSGIFSLSGETEQLCISAMRIISISFIFAGANIAFQGIFQALDGGIETLIISFCRQLIFVLPVAWIFSKIAINSGSTYLVWYTFIIAEGVTAAISCLLMKRISKKQKLGAVQTKSDGKAEVQEANS